MSEQPMPVLSFSPPLPCSALDEHGAPCGQPATAGFVRPVLGGTYDLLPVCRDCAAALQRLYGEADE